MTTSSEGNKRLVTIRRGLAGTGTDGTTTTTTGAYNETEDDTQTEDDPPVAQVELHQIRSSKISIKGMPQIKLKDWLGGRGTVHKFTEAGTTYEWRKSFHGLSHKRELFSANDDKTRLAWAEKVGTTSETGKPHEPGMPPMPANPGTATLTVSRRAQPIIEMVIVSFLLVDRESREQ
ncbi:hypothetical protein BKA62DRAFT_208756 [Auriculariales sp. MPI-PUGE-AT-0066]|nr:hypothetical protein BKA62DRAFT_208756 [Auriculariales sp. MPI-PUGE-AT-0066]